MTAVCAVIDDGKVWMGGDSAGVSGYSIVTRSDAKVFTNGPFLFGFTTSFRMGGLLRWSLVPPVQPEGVSDERFMSTSLVDTIRECLKAGGFAKRENEVEQGGTFLVGYRGQIWHLDDDYQVGMPIGGFYSVGSGRDLCLGALHALSPSTDPESRITIALQAAERFNSAVRSPYVIVREP